MPRKKRRCHLEHKREISQQWDFSYEMTKYMNILDVLQSPIITEKSMADAEKGKFTFAVALSADKKVIRQAIEEQFKVKVVGISTVIVKGKIKRVGKRRTEKKLGPVKKAVVTLEKGQKIELFDLSEKK